MHVFMRSVLFSRIFQGKYWGFLGSLETSVAVQFLKPARTLTASKLLGIILQLNYTYLILTNLFRDFSDLSNT
jgi:hypothetical protein